MSNPADLAQRVEALEKGAGFDATKAEVQKVQMEYLEKLRSIRQAMTESSASTTSSKEAEALATENANLKRLAAKQAYRIEHLVATVDTLLKK